MQPRKPHSPNPIVKNNSASTPCSSPSPSTLLVSPSSTHHIRPSRTIPIGTTSRTITRAPILRTTTGLESLSVCALGQRDARMLVRRILLTHRQSFIGAAVGPDEDGGSDHLGAVCSSPGLGRADIVGGCVFVALSAAPDAFGGRAAVVSGECGFYDCFRRTF